MKLTRRTLFATVAAVPLVAAAQDAPPAAATSREEDLKSARDTLANNLAQLAKVEVPIATEPAFIFKA